MAKSTTRYFQAGQLSQTIIRQYKCNLTCVNAAVWSSPHVMYFIFWERSDLQSVGLGRSANKLINRARYNGCNQDLMILSHQQVPSFHMKLTAKQMFQFRKNSPDNTVKGDDKVNVKTLLMMVYSTSNFVQQ